MSTRLTVIHLAAQTIVGVANPNPSPRSIPTSAAPGRCWRPADAARRHPDRVALSDKAYGDQDVLPYTEVRRCRPASVRRQQVLRGPDRADVREELSAARLRDALRQLLRRGRSELEPSGSGHDSFGAAGRATVIRSDGHFTRDYLYVEDGARAYLQLAEQMAAEPALAGEVFNFAYEHRMTVLELVAGCST